MPDRAQRGPLWGWMGQRAASPLFLPLFVLPQSPAERPPAPPPLARQTRTALTCTPPPPQTWTSSTRSCAPRTWSGARRSSRTSRRCGRWGPRPLTDTASQRPIGLLRSAAAARVECPAPQMWCLGLWRPLLPHAAACRTPASRPFCMPGCCDRARPLRPVPCLPPALCLRPRVTPAHCPALLLCRQ